jgi:hypothetical protein
MKTYVDVHAKFPLFLPDINQTWKSLTGFAKKKKHPKYGISQESYQWQANGRRDTNTDFQQLVYERA